MKNKLKLIFFISILLFSCDSIFFSDKEAPDISWKEYKINSEDSIELTSSNLEIDFAFELLEFKVKVTDDGSDIEKVKLFIDGIETEIYSTTVASGDIYTLKWNTTGPEYIDSTYTLRVKATDTNENEKESVALTVNLDQSFGFPYTINVISIIDDDSQNCIYWENDSLSYQIPDFSHYTVYNIENDSLYQIHSIYDINIDNYCHSDLSGLEKLYNVAVIDSFGFSSEMAEPLSNFSDHNPIPIDYNIIEYTGDFVTFDWEESPDVDFNRYELWYYCDDCEFSNTPFYQTANQEESFYILDLFDNTDIGFESLFPNKSNEFWIKSYDQSNNVSIGKIYITPQNYPPNSVNVKSLDYSVAGIDIEWYLNETDSIDFKAYNLYHSVSETEAKVKIISIIDLSTSMTFIDSSFISEESSFSFNSHFNPFNDNWFWIGVEDKFGNISIGSGMTNLIDIPPPSVPISNWTYWKRDANSSSSPDTIKVEWESLEDQISDFLSYTIYISTVSDSIQDTLGSVFDVEQNNFQFPYFWDEEVDCNQSGKLFLWGKVKDAWGQETLSESVIFTEIHPEKPSITSIYYESIEDEYVIEWNKSEDLDFKSYTIYYKHDDPFSHSDIFNDNCFDNSQFHESNETFSCMDICRIEIDDQEETQFVYNLTDEDWTMYFLIVTDDIWGTKSFSTQEYDCDPDDLDCGSAEKATPFNQIIFQSNRGLETNIYSVELDFTDPNFPRLNSISNLSGENFNPKFEPWGARVIFYGRHNGNYEIFSIGAGGNNAPLNLTNHPGNDYNPQYISDGSKIIFESRRTGNHELFSMNKNGSGVTQLTFNNGDDSNFQIATNTIGLDKIIYVSTIFGNQEIFMMNENGTNIQNLTNHSAHQYNPDISADGEQIVYIGENEGHIDLYWENIENGDSLNLTNNNFEERNPQFILNGFYPNGEQGNYLIYESNKDGSWSMYFQKIPNYNDDLESFLEDNSPIDFLEKNSSDQSNPSFANIILDLIEGVYMVYESTEDGTSSIYIVNQFGAHPSAILSGKISDSLGDDFLPQIQP